MKIIFRDKAETKYLMGKSGRPKKISGVPYLRRGDFVLHFADMSTLLKMAEIFFVTTKTISHNKLISTKS